MFGRRPHNENEYMEEVINRSAELSDLFSLRANEETVIKFAVKKRLPPRYIKFIQDARQMLEDIYPGRGDIQFNLVPRFKIVQNQYGSNHVNQFRVFDAFDIDTMYLVVYFPEIEIKNGRKLSHTIKDLFTRIPVKLTPGARGGLKFERIQGTRTTLSKAEFISQYLHSHLPARGLVEHGVKVLHYYQNFCTGEGDINNSTMLLNTEYDPDMLRLLLLQIEPYVNWESLDGGPYMRIENVAARQYDYPRVNLNTCESIFAQVINKIKHCPKILDLDWKFYNNKFTIVDNDKLEDLFHNGVSRLDSLTSLVTFKDEAGNYFVNQGTTAETFQPSENWIPFRGKKIHFKVEGHYTIVEANQKKYINPKIKHYVKSRLEYKANNSKIREFAIGK